jgi:hypothetical protein
MCFKYCCFGRNKVPSYRGEDETPLLKQKGKRVHVMAVNDDCSLKVKGGKRRKKYYAVYFAGIRCPQMDSFDPMEARLATYVVNMIDNTLKNQKIDLHILKKDTNTIEAIVYLNNMSINDWMLYHNFALPEHDTKTTWNELAERANLFAFV